MITITNNYFADLNAAIAAGLFPANSKPKKAALYDAIAAHNEAIPQGAVYLDPQAQLTADVAALEEAGDEAGVQAALLAMDAAEDAAKPAPALKPRAVAAPRKTPAEILDELECLAADVADKGLKTIAQLLGTSTSRLQKKVKAYRLMESNDQIRQAFLNGKLTFSFLQESAVRKNGLQEILSKLAA